MLSEDQVAALNDQACTNNFGRQGEWDEMSADGKAWAIELARLAYEQGRAGREHLAKVAGEIVGMASARDGSVFGSRVTKAMLLKLKAALLPSTPASPSEAPLPNFREDVLLSMGVDWTWYRPEVLLDEVNEDPETVGTAEYWHDRFSKCLAMLEEAQGQLRAQAAERETLRAAINIDRTGLAATLNHVQAIVKGYWWIAEGTWGSYAYTEQTTETLQREVKFLIESVCAAASRGLRASGDRADAALRSQPTPTALTREALASARLDGETVVIEPTPTGDFSAAADAILSVDPGRIVSPVATAAEGEQLVTYPDWCNCGRGKGTPHTEGCAALTEPEPPPASPPASEAVGLLSRLESVLRGAADTIGKPGSRTSVPGYVMHDVLMALADELARESDKDEGAPDA